MRKVSTLLSKGSAEFLVNEKASKFGKQTGETHGGLLFSRSPTKFFHDAPGQLRDVDLRGCYASIISQMDLYVGRPVVYEPGSGKLTLNEAVQFLQEQAAGWDAWMVKVTGPITSAPNVLVPSTTGALTHANYRKRAAKGVSAGRPGECDDRPRADAAATVDRGRGGGERAGGRDGEAYPRRA
jgi:hypothetical protein